MDQNQAQICLVGHKLIVSKKTSSRLDGRRGLRTGAGFAQSDGLASGAGQKRESSSLAPMKIETAFVYESTPIVLCKRTPFCLA